MLLWAALVLVPRYAAFALVGLSIGSGVGYALSIRDTPRLGGGLQTNALLAAVMVAWITGQTGISLPVQIAMAMFSAGSAAIVAAAIMRVLSKTPLPSLVWGYCVVSGILCCTLPSWAELAAGAMEPWPVQTGPVEWVTIFIRSLGSLLYSPSVEAGLVVGVSILLWSRTMLLTGLVGWLSGTLLATAFTQLGIAYFWQPASYNSFLAGMALGSVFFLPGRTSILIAAVSGCGASFLALGIQHLLQYSASSYLPIPAALTIWIGIGALTLVKDRGNLWVSSAPDERPEDAWCAKAYWVRRFGHNEALLAVPLSGAVQVARGFDGSASRGGPGRHALDLRRPPTTNAGGPSDSVWGEPVTAPAAGFVARVVDHVADNPLGVSNLSDRWGNHVVIRLDEGVWATLAHLKQGSVTVSVGTHVEVGTLIGRVGNSGLSTIPHLHLQVQGCPNPDAPTIPFRLANYQSLAGSGPMPTEWQAASVPCTGDIVMGAAPNPVSYRVLTGITPGSAVWSVHVEGQVPGVFESGGGDNTVDLTITPEERGRFVLETGEGGKLFCALAPDAWRVIMLERKAPPLLKLLAAGAPSIPYAATPGLRWKDPSPMGPTDWWGLLVAPYRRALFPVANASCLSVQDGDNPSVEIESRLHTDSDAMPRSIRCTFELQRGPVKILAHFQNGSINCSLLSFKPAVSFDN